MKIGGRIVLCAMLSACAAQAQERQVSIGVLGLFHPREIVVSPLRDESLHCTAGQDHFGVREPLRLVPDANQVRLVGPEGHLSSKLLCDNGSGGAAEFVVDVPGKLSRHYSGQLAIEAPGRELRVVVTMQLETAVASIVAAESPPHAPLEALKAQAVATRSFLVAGKGRHEGFEFCDTTHCQFLRQPPEPGSPAFQAAEATQGLVLAYRSVPFAAMYSASCSGKTHSLAELGIPVRGYPYYGVRCDYCRRNPEKWVSKISENDAAGLAPTERSRLTFARKLGWKAVPGNSYSLRIEGAEVILEGSGVGHGVGLCQRGGADMARRGSSFQQILEHYYPNTELKSY